MKGAAKLTSEMHTKDKCNSSAHCQKQEMASGANNTDWYCAQALPNKIY